MDYLAYLSLRGEFDFLLEQPITEACVERCIEIIKEVSDDDEVAHAMEDDLRAAVLASIDHPLAKLALSTSKIEFSRWCA